MIYRDPVNGTINPLAIPGSVAEYTIAVANRNAIAIDANSVLVSDRTPTNAKLQLTDIALPGGGPARFVEGNPASTLTYGYVGLGDASDGLKFSRDNALTWTYVPTLDGDGCDAAITHFRIRQTGSLDPAGRFSILVRYRVN